MTYYHVRISRKSAKGSDAVKLDLSEEELRSRFIIPYYAGSAITSGGQVIDPFDIIYIRITKTADDSSVLLPRVIAEHGGRFALTVPIDWYVAKSGEDVTDDFITGSPGSGQTVSIEPGRSVTPRSDGGIFVIMPLREEWSEGVYDMIKRAVADLGCDPLPDVYRADDISRPGRITDQIVEAIESAEVIVADISGLNPNVMWELGFAQAKGKPVIMLNQEVSSSPFDIRDYRQVAYTRFPTQRHQEALIKALGVVLKHGAVGDE